jgi:hypothetical protein
MEQSTAVKVGWLLGIICFMSVFFDFLTVHRNESVEIVSKQIDGPTDPIVTPLKSPYLMC